MKMHVLSGGRLRMRKNIFLPDAPREETIELPVPCFLLRHPQGNVLFDTGCHPSVATDAEARWGGLARMMVPIAPPAENLINGLLDIGVEAADIDVIVCSHLHPDHCGCNAYFHQATVICHAAELAAARRPDAAKSAYLAIDWDQPMPIDAIDGERDIFGDDRIVLIPLPGHTPGTTSALVNLDRSGTLFLASDTVSLRANLDRDIIPRNTWSPDMLAKAFAEVRRIEAGGATIICSHDAAQWSSLRKGAEAYD